MREAVNVMPVRPEHDELLGDIEGRRTVAHSLGDFGQGQADRPYALLDVIAHAETLGNAGLANASGWRDAKSPDRRKPVGTFDRSG